MEFTCAAVLFDADGTLIDSIPAVERAWRTWSAEYGFDADAVLAVCHGRPSAETISELVPGEGFRAALTRLDDLEVADTRGVRAYANSHALLETLSDAGVPWAVVTSGNLALVTARLKAAELPTPQVLVTADSVTNGKPDPEGYLLAARQLGVNPAECVVIEDAPAGVRAGRAAGARVIAVTTSHGADELGAADVIVPDLNSVSYVDGRVSVAQFGSATS
ncbi:MAG TPA: HAD family hydrolase [Pseudonocardiaceae bacterium]|jgi:sugar-phosphatase|nr:HAD family hydrolase [Pseudonocardiaceae bacterium]